MFFVLYIQMLASTNECSTLKANFGKTAVTTFAPVSMPLGENTSALIGKMIFFV